MEKEFYMKNYIKFFGIIAFVAVIGFSFISCEEEDEIKVEETDGRLKITGFSNRNGQSVIARCTSESLLAGNSITSDGSIVFEKISSNEVTLKIWKYNGDLTEFTNFNKTTSSGITFEVLYKANQNTDAVVIGTVTVSTFSSGVGTGAFQ